MIKIKELGRRIREYRNFRKDYKEKSAYYANKYTQLHWKEVSDREMKIKELSAECRACTSQISKLQAANSSLIEESRKNHNEKAMMEETLKKALKEADEMKKQLSDSKSQISQLVYQNERKTRDIYSNILSYIGTKREFADKLEFVPEHDEKSGKWKVVTDACQLCGEESYSVGFDSESEAKLFCIVKTLAGHQFGHTCHTSCVIEYEREYCL